MVHRLDKELRMFRDLEIVLAPSMLALQPLSTQIDRRKFRLASQNAYFHDEGAFTGEVSGPMLADVGCQYVLIGHSERRHILGDSLPLVAAKFKAAVDENLALATKVGASGTPTFFINGQPLIGAQPFSQFKTLIDAEL